MDNEDCVCLSGLSFESMFTYISTLCLIL